MGGTTEKEFCVEAFRPGYLPNFSVASSKHLQEPRARFFGSRVALLVKTGARQGETLARQGRDSARHWRDRGETARDTGETGARQRETHARQGRDSARHTRDTIFPSFSIFSLFFFLMIEYRLRHQKNSC